MNSTRSRQLPYVSLACLLALDTAVFLFEKVASTRAVGDGAAFYLGLARQPLLWTALALGLLQLWTWTRILSKTDISLAYPITSLSYPVTMLAATLLLGEHLPWKVWAGGLLITLGVVYMGTARTNPAPVPTIAEEATA
jgi:drug/metabolite transporter (DMT)-like permease